MQTMQALIRSYLEIEIFMEIFQEFKFNMEALWWVLEINSLVYQDANNGNKIFGNSKLVIFASNYHLEATDNALAHFL